MLQHSWNLTPKEAVQLQRQLCDQIQPKKTFRLGDIKTIAGLDCAFDSNGAFGWAGVVVFSYPGLVELQRVGRRSPLRFPYVPGLLSFREIPLLLGALEKLDRLPDLLVVDGHGLAHPRGCGIASHFGLVIDRPTIGCAKSRLVGEHRMPAQAPGSSAPLCHEDRHIGNVLRTRRGCKPVYVSIGHRIDLDTATRIIMRCVDRYRIPKPTRAADHFVAELKRRGA